MGFPPDQMAVYTPCFLHLQLCLSGAQRALGTSQQGPRFRGAMPCSPPGTIAQSVLAFGTRSWNVCIRKQLGWRGTLRTPPEFLRPVTFSSGFPKMIPRAWGSRAPTLCPAPTPSDSDALTAVPMAFCLSPLV